MKFNKKGIMVKFLLTVILAIIIFFPACSFASSFFRLSGQARENFGEFVGEIKEIASKREGDTKSFMLIMDDETAIVGFSEGSSKVESCQNRMTGRKFVKCGYWLKPDTEECKEGSCVCLFTSILGWKEVGNRTPDFRYTDFNCKKLDGVVFSTQNEIKSLGEGEEAIQDNYKVTGGFALERGVDPIAVGPINYFPHSFNFDQRRNAISLVKKNNNVFVCLDSKCGDIKLLVKVKEGYEVEYEKIE